MQIELFPRISSHADRAEVMLGAFGVPGAAPPALAWTLNGRPIAPVALSPLQSVLDPADAQREHSTHTGLFECQGLHPGTDYELSARVPGTALTAQTTLKTLPANIPSEPGGGLHVLLGSCFYAQQANAATLRATMNAACGAIPRRAGRSGPDLAFFMGDQVYLDMPLTDDVPSSRKEIYQHFEAKYAVNWQRNLHALLRAAPHVCLPDDHEYWNNYPYAYGLAANTWTKDRRRLWTAAAKQMLARFQHVPSHRSFDVAPATFFLADGRSDRDDEGPLKNTLTRAAREALVAWVDALNQRPELGVGVFVTGQSLLTKPDKRPEGSFADSAPVDYADYTEIVDTLMRARRPLLLLTGDVHWGRVVRATHPWLRHPVHEIIVSPLSSVKDQRLRVLSSLKRLVGKDRGADWDSVPPQEPPAMIPEQQPPAGFPRLRPTCSVAPAPSVPGGRALFRGDQLAVLSIQRTGGARVSAKVSYWMIADRPIRHEVALFDVVP